MVSSESAKSLKISTILTPAVLTIVNESIVNVLNGKIIEKLFYFHSKNLNALSYMVERIFCSKFDSNVMTTRYEKICPKLK